MTHGLKFLGLATAAILVMGATAAPAVAGEFTAKTKYPALIDGLPVKEQPNALTVAEYSISCEESAFSGELSKESSTLTLNPAYNNCSSEGFEFSNVDVTVNGCAYVIHLGAGAADQWASTVDVECPAGKQFEVHVYFDKGHTVEICKIEIPEQKGLTGPTFTNETATGALKMEGEFKGLKYTQVGSQCGINEPTNGVRHITARLTGTTTENKENKLVID